MLLNKFRTLWIYIYNRLLGILFLQLHKPDKATSYIEKALQISINKDKLYFLLAKAYGETNNFSKSIEIFQNAIASDPNSIAYRWRLGILLLSRGRYKEALPELKFIFDNAAKHTNEVSLANISAVLALCYLALEKFELAEKLLQSARNIEPWDLDACKGTLDLYSYTGRSDLIPSFVDEYTEKYPNLYPAYMWMGDHTYYYLYKPKESLEWYLKALSFIEDNETRRYCESFFSSHQIIAELFDNYIEALYTSGEKEKAFSFVNGLQIKQVGGIVKSKQGLIKFHLIAGNYRDAEKLSFEAIKLKKDLPRFWSLLAMSQAHQNRLESASQSIDYALSLDPDLTSSLDVLGFIQTLKQTWESAIKTYEKLLQFAPQTPDWLRNLAYCCSMVGRLDDSRTLYEKVISLDPHNANVWVDLANIYMSLGNKSLAHSAYQNGLKYNWLDAEKRQQALQAIERMKLD